MNTLTEISFILVPAVLIYMVWLLLARLGTKRRSLERVFTESTDLPERPEADSALTGFLRRWLFLAGYRGPAAPSVFMTLMFLAIGAGLFAAAAVLSSGMTTNLIAILSSLPPPMGDLFLPFAYMAPWTVLMILVLVPWMLVRRARRQRVEKVEQDLPISLELLATLSEAGLGFDSALSRVLDAMLEERPLAREFRSYQSDLLAGRNRVESLRRLARRLEVSSISILVSALVQAEQLGSGIAQALRRQADDLRDRRRERANAFAMALSVKRMIPLVVCFMPGIFVWAIGPAMTQLFKLADNIMHAPHLK
jgi:tight adherence protein C